MELLREHVFDFFVMFVMILVPYAIVTKCWKTPHINPRYRAVLRNYQYVSPNLSLAEKLFLERWWNTFALYIPRWVAPNVVTSIGGCFICLLMTIAYLTTPNLEGDSPPWVYAVVFPFCIFVYNTMDGADGKHARNTRSGSPLGELFDHGVDAVVVSCITIVALDAGRNGDNFFARFIVLASQINFALSNFTLLHVGRQTFNPFDGQEAQLLTILSCFYRAVDYNNSFQRYLFSVVWQGVSYDVSAQILFTLGVFVCSIWNLFSLTFNLVNFYLKKEKCHYRNESKQSLGKLLHQLFVYMCFGGLSMYIAVHSPYWQWLVLSTFVASQMTNEILISRMTGVQFRTLPTPLILIAIAACSILFNFEDALPLWYFGGFAFFWWLVSSINTLAKFAHTLDISVFTIPCKVPVKQS